MNLRFKNSFCLVASAFAWSIGSAHASANCGPELAPLFQATTRNLKDMLRVEQATWGAEQAASENTISTRIETNPRSSFIIYDASGRKPLGSVVVVPLLSFDEQTKNNWDHYADLARSKEYIDSVKDPKIWYVVSISATPKAPKGTGTAIFSGLKKMAEQNGIRSIYSGVRIANYKEEFVRNGTAISDYLDKLKRWEASEEAYGAAVQSGGVAVGILENFYDDPPSMNYAILMKHDVVPNSPNSIH